MQTRKRAKSITFGKKKEKPEKEHKAHAQDEIVAKSAESTTELTEVEEKNTDEKVHEEELSSTLPHADAQEKDEKEDEKEPAAVTPADDFVIDTSPTATEPSTQAAHETAADADKEENKEPAEHELSQPVEENTQPPAADQPEESKSHELSSTLPPSAFTIQSNEQPSQEAPAEATATETTGELPKKNRFGLYFFIVAFLSFILGLAAMAGASYLGLVKGNIPNLPGGVQVSGLLGKKPTPTVAPPPATPTEKPVDLTAYTIAVLNGSGISGKAAEEKTALTTAGFKVSSTGNAANSNFTKTEISAKKNVNSAFITKLQDELGKSFDVDTKIATSPDSDTTDVTVTLGSQTSQ